MNLRPLAHLATAAVLGTLLASSAGAQIRSLPKRSPHAKLVQTVGVTELSVEYHRPAVRGRAIWGQLVPHGAVWRAGANENTIFETKDALKFASGELPAGRYGLHVLPTESHWTVIFSKRSADWGSYNYDEKQDALRVKVPVQKLPHCESMLFSFEKLSMVGGTLNLRWEKRGIEVPFEVDTPGIVMARIQKQLEKDESAASLLSAVQFALQYQVGLDEALFWSEKALVQAETANAHAMRAGVLEALGRKDEADEGVALAIEKTTNARQLATLGITFQQMERHVMAHAFLAIASERAPENAQILGFLAASQAALGQRAEAMESYIRAIDLSEPGFQRDEYERAVLRLEEEDA